MTLKILGLSILQHYFLGTPIKLTHLTTPSLKHFRIPHSPEFLLTSLVALSQPPLFIFIPPPLSPGGCVLWALLYPIFLSLYFLSLGEILTVSITLNTNEALMFLPIFYLSLQDSMYPTIHLTFLPKDSQTS